jgi:hypothetical protein
MKDDNWQKVLRDPSLIKADVKEHLTAETAYTKAMLASTEALQAAMFEEMKGASEADSSVSPTALGYYVEYRTGISTPVHAPSHGGPAGATNCSTPMRSPRARPFRNLLGRPAPTMPCSHSQVRRVPSAPDLRRDHDPARPARSDRSAIGDFTFSPDNSGSSGPTATTTAGRQDLPTRPRRTTGLSGGRRRHVHQRRPPPTTPSS